MKILSRVILTVLILILAGLVFLFFAPDYNLYMVRSESMKPNINMGDLIINGPASGEIEAGTIITYERNSELITHRVQSVDGNIIVTKGDAVEDADPWQVQLSDVRGLYLFRIPYVGYVTSFVQTKVGWFVSIIIPAAILVGWLAKDIIKEAFA